jgi:hypothetical protein
MGFIPDRLEPKTFKISIQCFSANQVAWRLVDSRVRTIYLDGAICVYWSLFCLLLSDFYFCAIKVCFQSIVYITLLINPSSNIFFIFISNFDIFYLIPPSDIVSINELTLIIIGHYNVKTHYDVTNKINNISFEVLYLHYY